MRVNHTVVTERDAAHAGGACEFAGERVQFIGVGSVDAVVDFSSLDAGSVQISENNTKVVVTLPNGNEINYTIKKIS